MKDFNEDELRQFYDDMALDFDDPYDYIDSAYEEYSSREILNEQLSDEEFLEKLKGEIERGEIE